MKSRQAIGLATGAALAVGAVLAARAATGPSSAPASLQDATVESTNPPRPTNPPVTVTPIGAQAPGTTPSPISGGTTPSPSGAQVTPTGPAETVTRIPGLPTAAPTVALQPGTPRPTQPPTPKPYEGGATLFGPFRLIPAGQLPPARERTPQSPAPVVRRSNDPAVARSSSLYISSLAGWREVGFETVLLNEVVSSLVSAWEKDGLRMTLYSQTFDESRLPIDVGLTLANSATPPVPGRPISTSVEPMIVAGRYVILTGPTARQSERFGTLIQFRIWLDGILLEIETDTLSRNEFLDAVSEILAARTRP